MTPQNTQSISLRMLWLSSVSLNVLALLSSAANAGESAPSQAETIQARYLKLDRLGNPAPENSQTWFCIKDLETKLTWEVKTPSNRLYTYSWYSESRSNNGGFAGYQNRGHCPTQCDTLAYTNLLKKNKFCGLNNWRLPQREELRDLVDYQRPLPGPAITTELFPNTVAQFYWSATPDANNPDSAWGIGFTFGFDYAYFKSDHGHIRLVAGPKR